MNIGLKDVLYSIRPFFILYLIVLGACLLLKLLYTREQIFFEVNSWNSAWADVVEPYLTDLGEGYTVIALSVIIALFSYRKALLLITSYAVTGLVAQVVKRFADAPRPSLYFKHQWAPVHTVKGIEILAYNSFPSGHTTTAFSAAVVLTYIATKKGWGIPALILAMLIGYSRMYLTQHFFEDVMGGSVIGVMFTVFWLYYIDNKKFIHTVKWQTGLIKTIFK